MRRHSYIPSEETPSETRHRKLYARRYAAHCLEIDEENEELQRLRAFRQTIAHLQPQFHQIKAFVIPCSGLPCDMLETFVQRGGEVNDLLTVSTTFIIAMSTEHLLGELDWGLCDWLIQSSGVRIVSFDWLRVSISMASGLAPPFKYSALLEIRDCLQLELCHWSLPGLGPKQTRNLRLTAEMVEISTMADDATYPCWMLGAVMHLMPYLYTRCSAEMFRNVVRRLGGYIEYDEHSTKITHFIGINDDIFTAYFQKNAWLHLLARGCVFATYEWLIACIEQEDLLPVTHEFTMVHSIRLFGICSVIGIFVLVLVPVTFTLQHEDTEEDWAQQDFDKFSINNMNTGSPRFIKAKSDLATCDLDALVATAFKLIFSTDNLFVQISPVFPKWFGCRDMDGVQAKKQTGNPILQEHRSGSRRDKSKGKPAGKAGDTSLLSFEDDASFANGATTLRSKKKSGFGADKGSGPKLGFGRDKSIANSSTPSNVQPQAGEYTKEKLAELQRNTIRLGGPAPPVDNKSSEPVVVLKGLVKPVGVANESTGDGNENRERLGQLGPPDVPSGRIDKGGRDRDDRDRLRRESDDAESRLGLMGIGIGAESGGITHIPDAAAIAAAKAKRERLRQAQAAPDYISLATGDGADLRSKLRDSSYGVEHDNEVEREEDESSADEAEVQGRLAFLGENTTAQKKTGHKNRTGVFELVEEKAIEGAALEEERDEDEEDEERRWEEEQLRKGFGKRVDEAANRSGAAASIVTASQAQNVGFLAGDKYLYMQELRKYIGILCDFLQDKAPIIEELEEYMQRLHEERANAVTERREGDNTDELAEVEAAVVAARAVFSKGGGTATASAAAAAATFSAKDGSNLGRQVDEFGRDVNLQKRLESKRRAEARAKRAAKAASRRVTLALSRGDTEWRVHSCTYGKAEVNDWKTQGFSDLNTCWIFDEDEQRWK